MSGADSSRPTHVETKGRRGFFRVDSDRKILEWDPGMQELTGYSAEEVIGMPCVVGIRCSACLSGCGVFENGEVEDVPLVLFDRDGQEVRVHKSGKVVRDDQGEIIQAVETVTLQSMQRSALDDHLDRLLGSLGRLWIQADSHFEIISLSAEIAEMTGIPEHRFLGMGLEDLFGSELFGRESFFRREIASGQHREDFAARLPGATGTRIPVRLAAGRLADETNPARYFLLLRGQKETGNEAGSPETDKWRIRRSPAEDSEAQHILEALREAGFHRATAAEHLGMSRTTLWRKMNRYEL